MDMVQHGTSTRGEANSRHKLTAADVLEIRRRTSDGERRAALAEEYRVSKGAVDRIVQRRNWAWL